MKNILFIHQSAELYGSDKTLLLFLKYMDKTRFCPVVILPFEGPLQLELEKENIKVVIAPVLKLYRKMFSPKNQIKFFKDIRKAFKIIDDLNKIHHFDIIYSNTLAVLLGVFYAKKSGIKHIWHVHEIIESPKIFTKVFRKLLDRKSNTKIIYNSVATKLFWDKNKSIADKSVVITNGLEIPNKIVSDYERIQLRKNLFSADDSEIIIALVGRISRWKGQKVLLSAFYELSKLHKNIKLAFIGSPPPNQEIFLEELKKHINTLQISDKVFLIPFIEDITNVWQIIDIAAVPSTEPEPFGLVAVEAMLAKKPVIASNHGGLTEIIINNETGFLVKPNSEENLVSTLQILIENKELRTTFGIKGYERAKNEFSVQKYIEKLENSLSEI